MQFKQIVGQQKIIHQLLQTVADNRISHAQLFIGAEGTGNLALALAYSQYINCTKKENGDSCGTCPSCHKYQKLIHPDLHFVFPTASSNEEGSKRKFCDDFLPEWRTILLESPYFSLNKWCLHIGVENKQPVIYTDEADNVIRKLSLKSYEAEYKVMIIWMPEKMRVEAANKLLKLIEEPPDKTLFLLVASDAADILPTIFSRTQMVKIPKIDNQSLAAVLTEKYQLNRLAMQDVLIQANGNYIHAIEAVQSSEEILFNSEMFELFMRLSWMFQVPKIQDWINKISEVGRERQKNFLAYSIRMFRENFIANQKNDKLVYLSKKEKEFASRFSVFINEKTISIFNSEFEKAFHHIERNAFGKLVFFDLFCKSHELLVSLKK